MQIEKSKKYPWLLVGCYSALGICLPAAVTQFSMLVGTMAKELQVTEQVILGADSLRAVCLVTAMFLSGAVYKKLGLKKTIMLGLFCQIAPQFLVPLAISLDNIYLFYIFKGMQGLNAVAFPLYIATITSWIDDRYKGMATAIFNGSFTAGAGIGAWIAGKVIPRLGWKISFYVVGGMCLFFAIPALLITKEKTIDADEKILSPKGNKKYSEILRHPIMWLLVITLLATTWISQAVTVDMSIYATYLGHDYARVGQLMLIISIVTVIASILAGGISDYVSSKSTDKLKSRLMILILGYVLAMCASLVLPSVGDKGFEWTACIASAMMTGVAWAQGVFWAIPSQLYNERDNIIATSICSGASNIVNPIAPIVVGIIFGTRGLWGISWLTCAIVAAISIGSAIVLPRIRKKYSERD